MSFKEGDGILALGDYVLSKEGQALEEWREKGVVKIHSDVDEVTVMIGDVLLFIYNQEVKKIAVGTAIISVKKLAVSMKDEKISVECVVGLKGTIDAELSINYSLVNSKSEGVLQLNELQINTSVKGNIVKKKVGELVLSKINLYAKVKERFQGLNSILLDRIKKKYLNTENLSELKLRIQGEEMVVELR